MTNSPGGGRLDRRSGRADKAEATLEVSPLTNAGALGLSDRKGHIVSLGAPDAGGPCPALDRKRGQAASTCCALRR